MNKNNVGKYMDFHLVISMQLDYYFRDILIQTPNVELVIFINKTSRCAII